MRALPSDPESRKIVWERAFLIGLIALYYIVVYVSILKITMPWDHRTLYSKWDLAMPWVPAFLYFYLQIYFMVFIPTLFDQPIALFRKDFLAYVLNMTLTYLVFLFFPTSINRPPLSLETFNEFGLAILYRFDIPAGCFPSMHVSMAVLAAFMIFRENHKLGTFAHVVAFMISIATLLLHQHYIVDVLGGYAMATFSYGLVFHKEMARALSSSPQLR